MCDEADIGYALYFYFVLFADEQGGYHGGGSALVSTASLF